MDKSTFSFDAETNGLWGQAFAIAALVYNEGGVETARFVGRCPIEGDINPWVADNVLPQMTGVPETHGSYEELLGDFALFYLANKVDADVVVHMGVPVESTVLKDMHTLGLIGDWDGPFPLFDLASSLAQAGEDATSVDAYCVKHGIDVSKADFEGGSHNPLFDSAVAAAVWIHLQTRRTAS